MPRERTVRELIWIIGILAVGVVLITEGTLYVGQQGWTFGEWGWTPVLALIFAVATVAFGDMAPASSSPRC